MKNRIFALSGIAAALATLVSCKDKAPQVPVQDEDQSFTINLYYKGEGDNARLFMEEMESSGIADSIRSLDGVLRYEYFLPAKDSTMLLLIDSYENPEALARYHESPLMAKVAALREKYDLHTKAEKYKADKEGLSQNETKYLRK